MNTGNEEAENEKNQVYYNQEAILDNNDEAQSDFAYDIIMDQYGNGMFKKNDDFIKEVPSINGGLPITMSLKKESSLSRAISK
jgi:hypothetical protein